jgi:glycine betaine/proline transport system substrate-binding protein
MRRLPSAFLGAITLLLGMGQTTAAENDLVVAMPNWVTARATGEVIKYVGETKLGLEIGAVPGTNPVIFKSMSDGKGDLDVHPEVWMPNQANLAAEYIEEAKTVAFVKNHYESRSGYCGPRHTLESHGLKSIFDILSAETSAKFDTNGDGRGELFIGGPGWASTNIEKVRMREFGVDQFWELVEMEGALFYSNLATAARTERPYLGFCSSPHFVWAKYDLEWLEEPPYDNSKWNMIQPKDDPEWFEKSKISTGWPPSLIRIAYSKSLEERAPQFVDFLNRLQVLPEYVAEWQAAIIGDKVDARDAAKAWVEANGDIVDKWLGL